MWVLSFVVVQHSWTTMQMVCLMEAPGSAEAPLSASIPAPSNPTTPGCQWCLSRFGGLADPMRHPNY